MSGLGSFNLPKGYWIAHVDVTNPRGYQSYIEADAEVFREYGARFLVRGGAAELVEGRLRARHIVIEFKDYATAVACYHSPEYQKLIALRQPHATADIVIIGGYEGPQP
jgi:uncharacterized protein (DUF1330 family)